MVVQAGCDTSLAVSMLCTHSYVISPGHLELSRCAVFVFFSCFFFLMPPLRLEASPFEM